MIVLHSGNELSLTAVEITEQRDFGKRAYEIDTRSNADENGWEVVVVGIVEFHPEIKQWAIEPKPGFAFTQGFVTKIYETLLVKRMG